MKKQLFTTIFILTITTCFTQNYFNTTTSSSNLNLPHLGTLMLGNAYESLNDPWKAGEGRFFEMYRTTGNVSMKLGNSYGKLGINIARTNGYFLSIDSNIPIPPMNKNIAENKKINNDSSSLQFFNNKRYQLDYFEKNGEKKLDLIHTLAPGVNISRKTPDIGLSSNESNTLLEVAIEGFCNGTSAKYIDKNDYFEVIERGGTNCKKVNYEITEDQKGLWSDENHKLYFSETVLSVEKMN